MATLVQLWKENLSRNHKAEIDVLRVTYPKNKTLTININNTDPELFNEIVKDPVFTEFALYNALVEMNQIPAWNKSKYSLNIRFTGFPNKVKVRDLDSSKLEKFMSMQVIVRKTTEVKPKLVMAAFKCNACKSESGIKMVPVDDNEVIAPEDKCLCGGKSWRHVLKKSIKKDYQLIQVQDLPEDDPEAKPKILTVLLLDDLAGKVQTGNIIVINGIYKGKQKKVGPKISAILDTYLDAKSIEIKNKDFTKIEISEEEIQEFNELSKNPQIYEMLWSSIAGVVKGHEAVKQAILLQLLGGVEKITDDGDKLRADFHVLLCGDPSVAKSKILKSAFHLCPRGIYVSGKATTAAGLTAAAVKGADGAYEIEAGAAVLADRGMLFLDELDKVDKSAVESLHEIMEDQVLAITKAGINALLSTKESILAACNPKRSRFDKFADLGSQVSFPPSLLSRFALIFLLLDEPNAKKDKAIAEHIINTHRGNIEKKAIPVEKIRKYIAHAKQCCNPVISDEAATMSTEYYENIRSKSKSAIPITPRQLEDIIRMSEASAKTRLSKTVDKIDVERAIFVYEEAMQFAKNPVTGEIDCDKSSGYDSQDTRDEIKLVKEIRSRIEKETHNWPGKNDIVKAAVEQGMDETDARSAVQKLWKELGILSFT
jgi:replicative DNA helicase Mcm